MLYFFLCNTLLVPPIFTLSSLGYRFRAGGMGIDWLIWNRIGWNKMVPRVTTFPGLKGSLASGIGGST